MCNLCTFLLYNQQKIQAGAQNFFYQLSPGRKMLQFNASDSGNSTNGRWAGAVISCPGTGVSHLRAIIQLHNQTPLLSLSPMGDSAGGIAPLRI